MNKTKRKRKENRETYTITDDTMGIFWNDDPYYSSKILEPNKVILCRKSPIQIISQSCIMNESTLDKRRKDMESTLQSNSKLPIAINPEAHLYFFPTRSPRSVYCNWIAFYHVLAYDENKEESLIIFSDQTKVKLTTPGLSLQKQMHRTAMGIVMYMKESFSSPADSGVFMDAWAISRSESSI
ncbi:hypothetical protein GLW08_10285 [Pontibacillus yanchengensis]|uniref:Uncharacterized protein n=2 Tax=Pontibacillus yanchengensis TaxID=462910 RepID=A0ACC7VFI4_9BACI|nr:competence protein ComK [Pontibacillus yanchengensis]MYL34252.1 hypothetical protein [Pontibacillus yanchengensis]MYL53723.1 hypothetical protein [Pontibacillus yanchengensis]